MKKEIKQKIKKIKDYEIDDNKLAALVFIVASVLGLRAGNYLRLFVFEHETNKIRKKRKKEKEEKYSNIYGEPEPEDFEAPRDDETKGDDDDRAGIGAFNVSLFGKNKNRKFKKVALATLLGGGLGVGTGIYLRNNKIKKERKIEENKRKESEENMKKNEEVYERGQKKLRENDAPTPGGEKSRKKIEFEEFDKEYFNRVNIPFKDDEDFEIKADSDLGDTRLQEQGDLYRAMGELEKSKKKLKEDKKKTKKKKKWFSRNKDIKKKIGIIKEQIKENEKQSEEFQEIYKDYLENKEKRLTKRQLLNLLLKGKDKKDIVKLLSEEAGEDENNLKYFTLSELEQMLEKYPFWVLQKMYDNQKEEEAKEEHQRYIQKLLNSEEEAEQEVMLFGKKKRKRKRRKKKRK